MIDEIQLVGHELLVDRLDLRRKQTPLDVFPAGEGYLGHPVELLGQATLRLGTCRLCLVNAMVLDIANDAELLRMLRDKLSMA